ncbi:hypothetical protein, partial [Acinetobacter variabilis]|uniref:hypothetical protein n=1 Tax=Acinetobacter variabilis TaxID=70346 RepID=UPI0030FA92C8
MINARTPKANSSRRLWVKNIRNSDLDWSIKPIATITEKYRMIKRYLYKGEFKHEVRQFQKPYDNQQAEQISLM